MPARDLYHDAVRNALIKDGWTITDDPLRLSYGKTDMYVDLGAERLVAAEKSGERIAVEIKGFGGRSDLTELERAVGQFVVYRLVLEQREPERVLYLAVPDDVVERIFEEPLGQLLLKNSFVKIVSFDPTQEALSRWIN